MAERIGNVTLNLSLCQDRDDAGGEAVEEDLLRYVLSGMDADAAIAADGRWPVFLHLTKRRELIVQPMEIHRADRVLEIGAGCGAVTGALCDRAGEVHSIEPSGRRALIISNRHRSRENLKVFAGGWEDLRLPGPYDVVTVLDSFARTERHSPSGAPYNRLLSWVRDVLAPGGRLYVAAENRFGLKRFAGRDSGGIAGDLRGDAARAYSEAELRRLLAGAGFSRLTFYYPFPDHLLPEAIYSEAFPPSPEALRGRAASEEGPREPLFDEERAFSSLLPEDFFWFSNSFLAEAKA